MSTTTHWLVRYVTFFFKISCKESMYSIFKDKFTSYMKSELW